MKQEIKKGGHWINEAGEKVPVDYIFSADRLKERRAHSLLTKAKGLNAQLVKMKHEFQTICDEVCAKVMTDLKASGETKGNFTWYNFDRSVKVEVSVNERIEFDDLTIKACKEKLDQFLANNIESKLDFVKELVTDAFSTTRGKLDAKKVTSLLRYRDRVKEPLFQESLALIEQAMRKPSSKTYYRVSERQGDGSYKVIDLNFSSI